MTKENQEIEYPVLFPEREAASYLGGAEKPISVKTLQLWRWRGKGPRYIKLGRLIRYPKQSLDDFLEKGMV